ncbi:MAG TPA: protein translocase subunit SecF [Acidobacteriota bacterium]|nr:protein translocase subunit SecF [Acidobacteriota bacterium]
MRLFKETNINFLKYKYIFLGISIVIIIAGLAIIAQRGLSYGVDFSGGTAIHVKFRKAPSLDKIRSTLKDAGFVDSGVQGFNDPTQVLIRLPQKVSKEEEIDQIAKRVSEVLNKNVAGSEIPAGKEDLNTASDTEIRQYLAVKDPWGVRSPDKYDAEVKKLSELRKANTGLFPRFEEMKGVDPRVINALKDQYVISNLGILSTEYVGPQVGSELREQAKLAIIWSLIGLMAYVWFRFQLTWGVSAVLCLAHDVLITLAFFAFFNREISLTVVAAFLTIVGFSLNDTIVIYDRVRDNLKSMRTQSLESVINLSLNQMLNRTILTNGTVTIVTIVLYFFGGEVINDFAFAMLIGCVSGTYSTIYIASALIIIYDEYFGKKRVQAAKAKVSKAS